MSNQPAMRGYVVGPGEGVPDRTPDVKASGRSTGGSLTVMELTVDGGPPRHTHTHEDESFYVFTGVVDVECGEDRFEAGPGSFVFLPRDLSHTFRSVGGPVTALPFIGYVLITKHRPRDPIGPPFPGSYAPRSRPHRR